MGAIANFKKRREAQRTGLQQQQKPVAEKAKLQPENEALLLLADLLLCTDKNAVSEAKKLIGKGCYIVGLDDDKAKNEALQLLATVLKCDERDAIEVAKRLVEDAETKGFEFVIGFDLAEGADVTAFGNFDAETGKIAVTELCDKAEQTATELEARAGAVDAAADTVNAAAENISDATEQLENTAGDLAYNAADIGQVTAELKEATAELKKPSAEPGSLPSKNAERQKSNSKK